MLSDWNDIECQLFDPRDPNVNPRDPNAALGSDKDSFVSSQPQDTHGQETLPTKCQHVSVMNINLDTLKNLGFRK